MVVKGRRCVRNTPVRRRSPWPPGSGGSGVVEMLLQVAISCNRYSWMVGCCEILFFSVHWSVAVVIYDREWGVRGLLGHRSGPHTLCTGCGRQPGWRRGERVKMRKRCCCEEKRALRGVRRVYSARSVLFCKRACSCHERSVASFRRAQAICELV